MEAVLHELAAAFEPDGCGDSKLTKDFHNANACYFAGLELLRIGIIWVQTSFCPSYLLNMLINCQLYIYKTLAPYIDAICSATQLGEWHVTWLIVTFFLSPCIFFFSFSKWCSLSSCLSVCLAVYIVRPSVYLPVSFSFSVSLFLFLSLSFSFSLLSLAPPRTCFCSPSSIFFCYFSLPGYSFFSSFLSSSSSSSSSPFAFSSSASSSSLPWVRSFLSSYLS